MAVGGIREVLVGVERLNEALGLFGGLLGLRIERQGPEDPARLALWDVAGTARAAELSCDGYGIGRVRLVEYDPPATERVRTHSGAGAHDGPMDVGPKAIDFYVPDPIAPVHAAVRSAGFSVRSDPVRHVVGETESEEFVFWGPGGVPLLLMVGHRHTPDQMRGRYNAAGVSEVATISIVGEDQAATRAFYEGVLGMELIQADTSDPANTGLANTLTGTPPGTRIDWLLYRGPGEPSGKILVVFFGGAGAKRLTGRMRPGRLGFSLLCHDTADLDGLARRLAEAGVAATAGEHGRGRALIFRGPNEELFEVTEARP